MKQSLRCLLVGFALFAFFSPTIFSQSADLAIDYTIAVQKPEENSFHVTTEIKNIKQDRLDLSLPVWTPGWYTIENYAKNISRFKITDQNGKAVAHTITRKQTWSVNTKNTDGIKIEFDYRANTLALNQAKITKDFAFFTGTQLFLLPEGFRRNASRVHFAIPANWRIVSALKETPDAKTFVAADYDALVDAPTEMGNFDVTKFEVEGKPHYFVASPAGTFPKAKAAEFVEMLKRVARVESRIFGGLPYEKYVYFYFFAPPESNASGALEHANSFVAFAPPGNVAEPKNLIETAAHEFFHLWNVKRIRPAEMFPYDYSRENESPLLWVSEGFTSYYAALAVYRAGLTTREEFLAGTQSTIAAVENLEARRYISPASSSASTWLGYDTSTAFEISYYDQGQNLGALLDISILRDTEGAKRLDDVMRALYQNHYLQNKGFTTAELVAEINRLTGKDYQMFFDRYVFGTEIPPYTEIFGAAGFKVENKAKKTPIFGFGGKVKGEFFEVETVEPASPVAVGGLQVGDVITKIDGISLPQTSFAAFAGKTVKLNVKRGAAKKELTIKVGSRDETGFVFEEIKQPTAEQLKIRAAWLKTSR